MAEQKLPVEKKSEPPDKNFVDIKVKGVDIKACLISKAHKLSRSFPTSFIASIGGVRHFAYFPNTGNALPVMKRCRFCGDSIIDIDGSSGQRMNLANISGQLDACIPCMRKLITHKKTTSYKVQLNSSMHLTPKWEGAGRTIGIEVECNPSLLSIVRAQSSKIMDIKDDHSLRGNGIEFTSPILRESTVNKWLKEFKKLIKARVYKRCGLHIWIGIPDFSWWDIYRLMRFCKSNEKIFFSMVSRSRRPAPSLGDHLSGRPLQLPKIPVLNTKESLLFWLYGTKKLHADGLSKMRRDKRANDNGTNGYPNGVVNRYWWINFHAFWYKRAIEIRLHGGTTNATKIRMWIRLWVDILDWISSGRKFVHPLNMTSLDVAEYYKWRIQKFGQEQEEKDDATIKIGKFIDPPSNKSTNFYILESPFEQDPTHG
jgi:hypothetical protein